MSKFDELYSSLLGELANPVKLKQLQAKIDKSTDVATTDAATNADLEAKTQALLKKRKTEKLRKLNQPQMQAQQTSDTGI